MNKTPYSTKPVLSAQEFYILLALQVSEGYAYSLRSRVTDLSLGALKIANGTCQPLLVRLKQAGLVDESGLRPAGVSQALHMHYRITALGVIRLKEELKRLKHALEVAEHNGLLDDEIPLDIQKMLLDAR